MAPSDPLQFDPGMLELFQAEMDAHIPVLDEGLLALEKGQADARQIEAMMRAAHSIKGAARIVGIEPAVRVAHVMEDCFTAAKESRITIHSDAVDVLLQGVDALQRICSPREPSPITEEHLQSLLEQIRSVRDGKTSAAPAANDKTVAPPTVSSPPPASQASTSGDLIAATVRRDEPGVTLPAVLDDVSSRALRKELLDTLALRPSRIELDFGQVNLVTAGTLALLASFAQEIARTEPAPVIVASAVAPPVRGVLRIAGLAGAFGLG